MLYVYDRFLVLILVVNELCVDYVLVMMFECVGMYGGVAFVVARRFARRYANDAFVKVIEV